jgi:hypothetical protein
MIWELNSLSPITRARVALTSMTLDFTSPFMTIDYHHILNLIIRSSHPITSHSTVPTTTHAWTEPDHQTSISISISTHHALTDPFADADFGSPASSATAGAKANASRTSTPKIDDDLGGVAGGKIHIRESSSSCLILLSWSVC